MAAVCYKILFLGGFALVTITPDQINLCRSEEVSVDVRWLLLGLRGPQISIYPLGGVPRLWIEAGRRGEVQTGQWLSEGTTIMLTDRHGHLIARKTLTSADCRDGDVASR